MKNIDIKHWNDMYDTENYPELTNGEAFHIAIYHRYNCGISADKINRLHMAYNDAVSRNDNKVKSAVKFICDWNGFSWEHFFSM